MNSSSAADYLPPNPTSLSQLRRSAAKCKGCDLYLPATQTVFGKGSAKAKIVLVGEQPGDKEDLAGEPFVGPAGQLLDKALAEAQIDRKAIYVTNAVKHFKFEERGKRRIHKKPKTVEIEACRPWLEAEIAMVEPQLIVSMGATALRSLFGKALSITKLRGQVLKSEFDRNILVTIHPAAILRLIDRQERHQAFKAFVNDLKKINTLVKM